jgi:hypothetical protein
MNRLVLWVVQTCCLEGILCFRGTYRLHLQDRRVSQGRNQKKYSASSAGSVGFLLGLVFHTEDGGDMFLRNVLSPNYTLLQLIGLYPSRRRLYAGGLSMCCEIFIWNLLWGHGWMDFVKCLDRFKLCMCVCIHKPTYTVIKKLDKFI